MRRLAIAAACAALAWIPGAGTATACTPALPVSDADRAAADLWDQEASWTNATSVYVARVARRRPVDAAGRLITGPQVSFSHEIVLAAEAVLKGPFPAGAGAVTLVVSPWCFPSDVERAGAGDRFVVYAGEDGASARSRMIALGMIRHPETLAAIVDSAASAAGL